MAYGGVPVEAHGTLALPLVVESTGGVTDSLMLRIPITSVKFGSEKLSVDPGFTNPPDSVIDGEKVHVLQSSGNGKQEQGQ